MDFAIGIDLGGSSVKSVVVDRVGRLLGQGTSPFDAAAPMDWAARIRAVVEDYEERQGGKARWIGLS